LVTRPIRLWRRLSGRFASGAVGVEISPKSIRAVLCTIIPMPEKTAYSRHIAPLDRAICVEVAMTVGVGSEPGSTYLPHSTLPLPVDNFIHCPAVYAVVTAQSAA